MVPLEHYLYLGGFLFVCGLAVVISKRNAIVVLMGIELMLTAANLNLVAFSRYDAAHLGGQMFVLFILVVAAAETAVALAIVMLLHKHFKTVDLDEIKELK
jgi:NADH-quinone oxidoreductase subunit K